MPRDDIISIKEREKAKGCQVIIPSTVFFSDDHIAFIAANDKDFCMVEKQVGTNMLEVRQNLDKEIKDRKAMTELHGVQAACSERSFRSCVKAKLHLQVLQFGDHIHLIAKKQDPAQPVQPQRKFTKEKGLFSDHAIIRYKTDSGQQGFKSDIQVEDTIDEKHEDKKEEKFEYGKEEGQEEQKGEKKINKKDEKKKVKKDVQMVKAINSATFNKLFEKAKNSLFREMDHIQTVIKHGTGIGDPITIDFQAPIMEDDTDIVYLKPYAFVDELSLLKEGQYKEYAHHQCLKMCQFLQKQRGIEIMSMTAEFLMDDAKNVWFSYSSRIKYRKSSHTLSYAELEGDLHQDANTKLEQAQLEELQEELETFKEYQATEKAKKPQPSYKQEKMGKFMEDYYQNIKQEQNIQINYAIGEKDKEFDAAFKQMRPDCLEKSFSEYLKKQTEVAMKDSKPRLTSSKAKERQHQRNEILSLKSVESQGTQAIKNNKTIDQIIGALDLIKSSPCSTRASLETKRAFNGGSNHRQEGTLNFRTIPRSSEVSTAHSGSRIVSNLKAELIKNNIITRTDLMKLYRPPAKKQPTPQENPFLNRSFVSYNSVVQPMSARHSYNIVQRDQLVQSDGYKNIFGTRTTDLESTTMTLKQRTARSSHRQGFKQPNTPLSATLQVANFQTRNATYSSHLTRRPRRQHVSIDCQVKVELLKSY